LLPPPRSNFSPCHTAAGVCNPGRAGEKPDIVCRLADVHHVQVLPMTIHQALRQYLARHPVIAPRSDGRAIADDLPRPVFSQDAILHAKVNR
jgi:hypothetical protein